MSALQEAFKQLRENKKRMKFSYEGSVRRFDEIIDSDWKGETIAISRRQALNNLTAQAKKDKGLAMNTMVTLDPDCLEFEGEYEEPEKVEAEPIHAHCPECGSPVNDAGECPVCDLGDTSYLEECKTKETLDEAINVSNLLAQLESSGISYKDLIDKLLEYVPATSHKELIGDLLDYVTPRTVQEIFNKLSSDKSSEVEAPSPDKPSEAGTTTPLLRRDRLSKQVIEKRIRGWASRPLEQPHLMLKAFSLLVGGDMSKEVTNEELCDKYCELTGRTPWQFASILAQMCSNSGRAYGDVFQRSRISGSVSPVKVNPDYLDLVTEFWGSLKECKEPLQEGRYADLESRLAKKRAELKELKVKLQNAPNNEAKEELEVSIDVCENDINNLEGELAEIRYIDNGNVNDFSGYDGLTEAADGAPEEMPKESNLEEKVLDYDENVFEDIFASIQEGANADIKDNIKKIFDKYNITLEHIDVDPTHIKVDWHLGNHTGSNDILLDKDLLKRSFIRFAEDIAHAIKKMDTKDLKENGCEALEETFAYNDYEGFCADQEEWAEEAGKDPVEYVKDEYLRMLHPDTLNHPRLLQLLSWAAKYVAEKGFNTKVESLEESVDNPSDEIATEADWEAFGETKFPGEMEYEVDVDVEGEDDEGPLYGVLRNYTLDLGDMDDVYEFTAKFLEKPEEEVTKKDLENIDIKALEDFLAYDDDLWQRAVEDAEDKVASGDYDFDEVSWDYPEPDYDRD